MPRVAVCTLLAPNSQAGLAVTSTESCTIFGPAITVCCSFDVPPPAPGHAAAPAPPEAVQDCTHACAHRCSVQLQNQCPSPWRAAGQCSGQVVSSWPCGRALALRVAPPNHYAPRRAENFYNGTPLTPDEQAALRTGSLARVARGPTNLPWLPAAHSPNATNWNNTVALCTVMYNEEYSDVVEWLQYYRCAP